MKDLHLTDYFDHPTLEEYTPFEISLLEEVQLALEIHQVMVQQTGEIPPFPYSKEQVHANSHYRHMIISRKIGGSFL